MIDDSDEPSRAGTPKPPNVEKEASSAQSDKESESNGSRSTKEDAERESSAGEEKATTQKESLTAPVPAQMSTDPSKPTSMTPEMRQRLRKLEKLESTYPGQLTLLTCSFWRSQANMKDRITAVVPGGSSSRHSYRAIREGSS